MKNIIGILITIGFFTIYSCGQSTSNDEENSSYRDTIESATPLDDNNMRNDQPTDELTRKDSLGQDSI